MLNLLNLHNNKEISECLNNNFEISKYSYHQINILINLLIGQYSKTKDKHTFCGKMSQKMLLKVLKNVQNISLKDLLLIY